jgi:predicted small integral membrane protein
MKGKLFTSKGIQCVPQYFIQGQLRTNVFLEENCSKERLTMILKGDVLCWLEFQTQCGSCSKASWDVCWFSPSKNCLAMLNCMRIWSSSREKVAPRQILESELVTDKDLILGKLVDSAWIVLLLVCTLWLGAMTTFPYNSKLLGKR